MTPLLGTVEQKAPHSAILAPCQAPPEESPFFKGKAAIIAVSVARPANMISAPVFKASVICSAPARATIFENFDIVRYLIWEQGLALIIS